MKIAPTSGPTCTTVTEWEQIKCSTHTHTRTHSHMSSKNPALKRFRFTHNSVSVGQSEKSIEKRFRFRVVKIYDSTIIEILRCAIRFVRMKWMRGHKSVRCVAVLCALPQQHVRNVHTCYTHLVVPSECQKNINHFLVFSISPSTDGLNNKRGINFFRSLLHWQWMDSFDIRNLKHISWPFVRRTNSISTESVSVHGELSIYEWVSFEFDGNIPQNYIIKCFPILSCRLSFDSIPYAPKCSHSYLNSYVMELRCIHILLCVIRLWHRLPTWLV